MTYDTHDRSDIYALCPPLAEWPDEAQWWAVDGWDMQPWYYANQGNCPTIFNKRWRNGSVIPLRFDPITLPAHIDWTQTLVSRAELDEWELEKRQDEIEAAIHAGVQKGIKTRPVVPKAPAQDSGHVPAWRDESIHEALREITHYDAEWQQGKLHPAQISRLLRRVRDDVAARCEARIVELERQSLEWRDRYHAIQQYRVTEPEKRLAELEQRIAWLEAQADA